MLWIPYSLCSLCSTPFLYKSSHGLWLNGGYCVYCRDSCRMLLINCFCLRLALICASPWSRSNMFDLLSSYCDCWRDGCSLKSCYRFLHTTSSTTGTASSLKSCFLQNSTANYDGFESKYTLKVSSSNWLSYLMCLPQIKHYLQHLPSIAITVHVS